MEFDFEHMMPVIAISVTLIIFLSGAVAGWLKWSFNTSIKLSQTDIETNVKGWMDSMETNIKSDMKELYSDKVNQAETDKDIERLQGDVIELKKEVRRLQSGSK